MCDNTDDKDKKPAPDSGIELKEVRRIWGQSEADIIKTFLESHGISSLQRGRVVQSVHPFTADGLGEIRVFVGDKDYERAMKLLNELPDFEEEPD
jgi:hypothetical protein